MSYLELRRASATSAADPALIQLTQDDCSTCPGHTLVYECTAAGLGITVWRGSALRQCSITLSHSLFSSGTTGNCNNREIVGYSVRAVENNYTSQLNVTVRGSMNGLTIECFYNDGTRESKVGERRITIQQSTCIIII